MDGVGYEGILVTLSNSNRRLGQIITAEDGAYRFFGSFEVTSYTLTITQIPDGVNFPITTQMFELRMNQEFRFNFEGITG